LWFTAKDAKGAQEPKTSTAEAAEMRRGAQREDEVNTPSIFTKPTNGKIQKRFLISVDQFKSAVSVLRF
jgi:hypothetical protein